jgi:hypothetical protein
MKKMIVALVAMVMMSMSAMAQSNDPNREFTFDRISSYLELTSEQIEPVKTAMTQFLESQKGVQDIKDNQMAEGWAKVINRHKDTMKGILSEKQFMKYDTLFNQSIQNASEKYQEQTKLTYRFNKLKYFHLSCIEIMQERFCLFRNYVYLCSDEMLLLSLIVLSPGLISYITTSDSKLAGESVWIAFYWLAPSIGIYLLNFYLWVPLLWFRHRHWLFGLINAIFIGVGNIHLFFYDFDMLPDNFRAGYLETVRRLIADRSF